MSSTIEWPHKLLPGTTDNFVSNEVIASGLSASQVWPYLVDTSKWESYYWNVSQITPPKTGSKLQLGETFHFSTFGFPPFPAECQECIAPTSDKAGRLAWYAKVDGDSDSAVEVYHAWIVENISEGRVRILTQETQNGKPAKDLAVKKPNPMLNGHQDWLDGLVKAASGKL